MYTRVWPSKVKSLREWGAFGTEMISVYLCKQEGKNDWTFCMERKTFYDEYITLRALTNDSSMSFENIELHIDIETDF